MAFTLIVATNGEMRGLLTDEVETYLRDQPVQRIARASHVEPRHSLRGLAAIATVSFVGMATTSPNDWFADLSPVRGPLLGPFPTRRAALDAETAWLYANHIPLPSARGS